MSEVANVIELGYRAQPTRNFSYSITAFHHIYDKLRSGQPPPFANVENKIEGTANGIEAWATYQVARAWRTARSILRSTPAQGSPYHPSSSRTFPSRSSTRVMKRRGTRSP